VGVHGKNGDENPRSLTERRDAELSAFAGCFSSRGIGICRMDYRHLPDVFLLREPCLWLWQTEKRTSQPCLQMYYKYLSVSRERSAGCGPPADKKSSSGADRRSGPARVPCRRKKSARAEKGPGGVGESAARKVGRGRRTRLARHGDGIVHVPDQTVSFGTILWLSKIPSHKSPSSRTVSPVR
jgi:hypothetical protein